MRVAVAMSGGMDSTAAAFLLKREGHEVTGLHMQLHEYSEESWELAKKAAAQIDVPIYRVDFTREFQERVVTRFVQEYARGRTPSPCPLCNRFVKMTGMLDQAAARGCEKLATGHYARVLIDESGPSLVRALDKRKDQSYFLFMVPRHTLSRILFPLGEFTKSAARSLLRDEGIPFRESDESQELCFIPDNDYRGFLMKKGIAARPGPVKDLEDNIIGTHEGITRFTVGQRRGIGVCGPEPLYVLRIDPRSNTVYVGPKELTYVSSVKIKDVNLLTSEPPGIGGRCEVKVRSTAKAAPSRVTSVTEDELEISFDEPQSGVAPGQAAVLYSGDRVLGGGWIEESSPRMRGAGGSGGPRNSPTDQASFGRKNG